MWRINAPSLAANLWETQSLLLLMMMMPRRLMTLLTLLLLLVMPMLLTQRFQLQQLRQGGVHLRVLQHLLLLSM